jgi:hypothetical protein
MMGTVDGRVASRYLHYIGESFVFGTGLSYFKTRERSAEGDGRAMLILAMCPLKNLSPGDLANISCRTEKIISALEFPGGPSVIQIIQLNPSEPKFTAVASVSS